MPARRNILRSIYLRVPIPEDLRAKLDLHLYSSVEGKVPRGAYMQFISERLSEFFQSDEGEALPPDFKPSPRFNCYLKMRKLLKEIARSESVFAARARAALRGDSDAN